MSRILFNCLLCAFFFCALSIIPARADTIFFKHRMKLECKIVGETPEGLLVILGDNSQGSMTIDQSTILRIEWDFDSRLEELERREAKTGDDFLAHYKLALWAEKRGHTDAQLYKNALTQYLYSLGKPNIPAAIHLHLGRMFEKEKTPNFQRAIAHYKTYLQTKSADKQAQKEAKDAVVRLQKRLPVGSSATLADSTTANKGGLETKKWGWQTWSNPAKLTLLTDTSNDGGKLLGVKYSGGKKEKVAFSLSSIKNVVDKKALSFDVFNPTKKPAKISVAIITGNFEWFESPSRVLKSGEWTTKVYFDLTRNIWKSKAVGWAYHTRPQNLQDVRSIIILIYNGTQSGSLYFDEIHFDE